MSKFLYNVSRFHQQMNDIKLKFYIVLLVLLYQISRHVMKMSVFPSVELLQRVCSIFGFRLTEYVEDADLDRKNEYSILECVCESSECRFRKKYIETER